MAFAFPKSTDKIVINNSLPPTKLDTNCLKYVTNTSSIMVKNEPKLPTLTNTPSLSECRTTCSNIFSSSNEYLKCGSSSLVMSALAEEHEMIKCIGSQRQQLYDCNKTCTTIEASKIMSGNQFMQNYKHN